MSTVAVAIICKTPASGLSKTRLSPPLRPDECAAISACFIRDLSKTIAALADGGQVRMPLDKTFFAKRFGVVADRFGVRWMVIVEP